MLKKTKKNILFLLIILFLIFPIKFAAGYDNIFYYRGIKLNKQEGKLRENSILRSMLEKDWEIIF